MRHALIFLEEVRTTFRGTVAQFGMKSGYTGLDLPTMMLKDVVDSTNNLVTDHVWFTVGKRLADLHLQIGDVISFQARVTTYEKDYKGYRDDVYKPIEIDYRLSNPTKLTKSPVQTTVPLCLFVLLKLGKEFNVSEKQAL